ncbi:Uncharacterized protein D0Z07_8030 [Hyphodiscus hymeniophilus]|uniref:Nitrogen regulatory protein areA GATA-like domain-containing protein n=1 Tax=Hyphodiscus hymeniophilus TaxID=353542 RepID=A0A9P6SNA5_9HELO|nr:Uncharacterized protein D0Z07_8030 [Hyphodiscus hymeniophilus]
MPSRLDAPVLTVDVGLIHKVDTRNVENLFSMWTVFSRCAGSLEEGRRLENLSWRLWNRETFCCDPVSEANATTPAISISSRDSEGRYSSFDVPELSGSLDSLVDEEALEFESDNTSSSTSAPLDISRPQIQRQDSVNSRSRGRERHITPDDLEKMVITIKEKKVLQPLAHSTHSYLAPLPQLKTRQPLPMTEITPPTPAVVEGKSLTSDSASDASAQPASSESACGSSVKSTTSVVRGFSPAHVSSSFRSIPLLNAPSSIPTADIAAATTSTGPATKKQTKFTLGGSSGDDSLSEQQNSMDSNLQPTQAAQQQKKKTVFQFGGSSNEEENSLPERMPSKSALTESIRKPLAKKQTSFQEEVATRTIQEEQVFDDDVFETDEDDIDESAIDDDDDSSEWEDSVEDSGNASIDEKTFFQRVDSRPNLVSRRSLITTMLHQNDRATALANAASKSTPALQRSRTTSPIGPSLAASPDSDDAEPLMMKRGAKPSLKPIAEIPRSAAQPIIMTTTNTTPHQQALSPRTTRRNMLATELTVSLRQHLLWERQQKSQTANAVLKRRHTAHDVANLKQYPDKVHMGKEDNDNVNASWNQYFSQGLGEYHSKGW